MSRTRVLAIVVLAALCRGDCSSDTTECTGAEEDWLGSLLPPGFSPHSSFVKCIGATLAGSVFALVGMVIEGRKERRQEKPISREELKLPRSSPRAMSPRLEKVNSPPAEVEGSPSPLPSAEMKRSQSMPSAQLKHIGSQEWKDTPKARSDEMNWRSTNGRLPRTISAPVPQKSGKSLSEMQQVERQVKSILNKLTWEKFDKLYTDLLTYCMVDDERLRLETLEVIARDVFKKATLQHNFIELYADLCAKLDTDLREKGVEVNFRRALLEQCQESFTVHLAPPEIDTCLDYEEQYEMLVKYKTKMLGNVKLIAHLLRLRMLAAKIIFHCIEELISIGSAEALETLCAFLTTLGSTLDKKQWSGYGRWQEVFRKVELFADDKAQTPRIRCLLKDLLDKRRNGWQEKKVQYGTGKKVDCASSPLSNEKVEKKLNWTEKKVDWMDARMASPIADEKKTWNGMGKKTVAWMDTKTAVRAPPFSATKA